MSTPFEYPRELRGSRPLVRASEPLRDREESLLEADLPIAVARCTCGRPGTFLRAAAVAFVARLMTRNLDLRGLAECGFLEGEIEVVPEIGAPADAVSATAARSEDIA